MEMKANAKKRIGGEYMIVEQETRARLLAESGRRREFSTPAAPTMLADH